MLFASESVKGQCKSCFDGGAGNYYIKEDGNDNNSGTSIAQAWKSIAKANLCMFKPGDVLHFEGGKIFLGNLLLDANDAGTGIKPVKITSYGGSRATINAGKGAGIKVNNSSHIIIENLNFIGAGRKTGNTEDGLFFNTCSNIKIENVSVSGFQHSGINISHGCNNFNLKNIEAHSNGFAGISSQGIYNGHRNKNVYIGHSRVYNNPGDPTITNNHSGNGIVAGETDNVIIEHCEAFNNGYDMPWGGNGPVGIWAWNADNVLIQHCAAYENKTKAGAKDGGGFDFDGGVTNSVMQYCISYNNHGAGYGIFQFAGAAKWNNNTIRYCISENDGNISANGNIGIWNGSGKAGDFSNLNFYNNVIVNNSKSCIEFFDQNFQQFSFYNNIFVSQGSAIRGNHGSTIFLANCWWNRQGGFNIGGNTNFDNWTSSSGKERLNGFVVGLNVDPLFADTPQNFQDSPFDKGTKYRLSENSLLRNKGLDLNSLFGINMGLKDFAGNPIPKDGAYDIGVFESGDVITSIGSNIVQNFTIYPNPVTDKFSIKLNNDGEAIIGIEIYDIQGALIKIFQTNQLNSGKEISTEGLSAGIYGIRILTNRNIYSTLIYK